MCGIGGAGGRVGRGQGGAAILHSLSDMLMRLLTGHHCGGAPLVGCDNGRGSEWVQNL